MAKPAAWSEDPASGGVHVHMDDGSTHLVQPTDPTLQSLVGGGLPWRDPGAAAGNTPDQPPDDPVQDYSQAGPSPDAAASAQAQGDRQAIISKLTGAPVPEPEQPSRIGRTVSPPPGAPDDIAVQRGTMDPGSAVWAKSAASSSAAPVPAPAPVKVVDASGGVRVKGGWTPQTRDIQHEEGYQLPPEAHATLDQANADELDAAQKKQEAELSANAIKTQWQAQQIEIAKQQQRDAEQRARQRDREIEDAKLKFENASHINPDRLWENKNVFQKIVAGISSFMSGLAGMGNGNAYTREVDDEIAHDVDLQLKNRDHMGQQLKEFYGQWNSHEAQQAAGEAARYQVAQQELDQMLAGPMEQTTRANAEQMMADLRRKQVERLQALTQYEQGKTVTHEHIANVPDRVVGAAAARVDPIAEGRAIAAMADNPEMLKAYEEAKKSGPQAAAAFLGVAQQAGGGGGSAVREQAPKVAAALGEAKVPDYFALADELEGLAKRAKAGEKPEGLGKIANAREALGVGGNLFSPAERENRMLAEQARIHAAMIASSRAVTADSPEAKALRDVATGNASHEDLLASARFFRAHAQRVGSAATSGFDPRAVQTVMGRYPGAPPISPPKPLDLKKQ